MEKDKILIDSCVWIALYDKNDRQHKKAVKLFEEIRKKQPKIIWHFLVLIETLSILKYKKFDINTLKKIRVQAFEAKNIKLISTVGIDLSLKVWGWFEEQNKLGLVDVVLLDYCVKNEVELVTFDKEMEEIWKKLKGRN